MRAFEFKPTQHLHEQESAQIKKDIDAIIRGVRQNPENADIVAKKLAALNDAAAKIISVSKNAAPKVPTAPVKTPTPVAVPKPITAPLKSIPAAPVNPLAAPVESLGEAKKSKVDAATQEALEFSSQADNLLLAFGVVGPEYKKVLMLALAEVKKDSYEKANKEFVGKQVEFTTAFKSTLEKLAAKIDTELEKIATVTPFNENDPAAEKPGLPTKLVGKLSAKSEKNLNTVKGKIVTGLNGVFSEIKDMGFTSGDEVKAAITEFLNDMIVGVVDFGDILKKKTGNVEELFKTVSAEQGKSAEYLQVFEKVKDAMWNTVIDIGKGTNMGPGELGLALILQPASKAEKGDLGYQGRAIELKGSRDAASGARLGLEMGNKSLQQTSYQSEILNKYFPRTKPKYAQQVPALNGKTKTVSLNLNVTGIELLNNLITRESNFDTKAFLLDSILLTLDGNSDDKAKWKKGIEQSGFIDTAINPDRTIDYKKWIKALTLIQYELYGGAGGRSEFKTIMVFSPMSSNFRVINNSKEFGKAIDDGQADRPNGIILSGGLSFNQDKFAKTPKVGIR